MADAEDIASRIRQLIQEYVGEHWASNQSVCYFSSIGVYLTHTVPERRAVLTKGLGEFLRKILVVRVVQFPDVAQKIGPYPCPSICQKMSGSCSREPSRPSVSLAAMFMRRSFGTHSFVLLKGTFAL